MSVSEGNEQAHLCGSQENIMAGGKKRITGDNHNKQSVRKQNRRKKSRRKQSPLETGILVIAAVVLCFSGFQLISIFLEYRAASDAYDSLRDRYVRVNSEAVESRTAETEQEAESQELQGLQVESFPDLAIDFEQLSSINEAMTGWISIPVLDLEYPVVKGTDNSYYVNHTFEKKENSAGSIFMDCNADPQMTDYNTFFYGHNMKNGSMFGTLKNFIRNPALCDSRPYFYYFTREKTFQYRIISYYVTEDGSYSYFLPGNDEEYGDYLDYILTNSVYKCTREIPEEGTILSLSTCYGRTGGTQRLIVHGILTAVQETQ